MCVCVSVGGGGVLCRQTETIHHLFFIALWPNVFWGLCACLGTNVIPSNIEQYKSSIQNLIPNRKDAHYFGLAAICWAT
jgi:hypothetical protein